MHIGTDIPISDIKDEGHQVSMRTTLRSLDAVDSTDPVLEQNNSPTVVEDTAPSAKIASQQSTVDPDAQDMVLGRHRSDPLHWFGGILVPPPLRQAQVEFRSATDLIGQLISINRRMLETEIEVRRTRKRLLKK